MALIVEHGILIGIIPPLIAIGISAVTYYMCIKQLSSVITMTLFISENTATLPLGKTYAFLRVEAVSYTHLDVYKRQQQSCSFARRSG